VSWRAAALDGKPEQSELVTVGAQAAGLTTWAARRLELRLTAGTERTWRMPAADYGGG